ncbi:MAG: hypothetical protein ACFFD4_36520 [Candidatus Odinarchaeota archaeon]
MSENEIVDYLKKALQYRKTIAFGLSLVGIFVFDITLGSSLPFWMLPVVLGLVSGILAVSARAGLFAALGAMTGRLLSILFMILTIPGFLATADLFMAIVGSFIGISLPAGALIVMVLSILICGIFAALGGMFGGALAKIIQIYLSSKEESSGSKSTAE